MQEATQPTSDLVNYFEGKIVGQPETASRIIPFIQTYRAGFIPENRPIGVFLLLGPTGTGKTRTVEVLAEALHGSAQRYLRVDCGEYQLDYEVAKLIGSPPGYLGHRETVPMLSKHKLSEATTPECDISLVLFDEIEKAAPLERKTGACRRVGKSFMQGGPRCSVATLPGGGGASAITNLRRDLPAIWNAEHAPLLIGSFLVRQHDKL